VGCCPPKYLSPHPHFLFFSFFFLFVSVRPMLFISRFFFFTTSRWLVDIDNIYLFSHPRFWGFVGRGDISLLLVVHILLLLGRVRLLVLLHFGLSLIFLLFCGFWPWDCCRRVQLIISPLTNNFYCGCVFSGNTAPPLITLTNKLFGLLCVVGFVALSSHPHRTWCCGLCVFFRK